jgi:1,4-alpha-glucan branching enzyme
VDDPEHVVYAIERSTVGRTDDEGERERIAFVFNLSDRAHEGYELPVPDAASAEVLIDTEWDCYGGTIARGDERATLEDGTLTADLPPFCGMALLLSPEEG